MKPKLRPTRRRRPLMKAKLLNFSKTPKNVSVTPNHMRNEPGKPKGKPPMRRCWQKKKRKRRHRISKKRPARGAKNQPTLKPPKNMKQTRRLRVRKPKRRSAAATPNNTAVQAKK